MIRFLCLLAVLLPRIILADCMDQQLTVWPPLDHRLPANGQVVLQGYGNFREPVATVSERLPRLVSETEEVPLRVVAVYRGQKRLSQAVLQPERPLQPGQRYALHLTQSESASSPILPTKLEGATTRPIAWTVTDADTKPPRWREVPRQTGKKAEMWGCGPVIFVNVSASVDEDSPAVQVLAEVQPASGGETVRFRLTPSKDQVEVGHGMCSGAFRLEEGVRYTVRLVAVDMAGNESAAPGDAVPIQGPAL